MMRDRSERAPTPPPAMARAITSKHECSQPLRIPSSLKGVARRI